MRKLRRSPDPCSRVPSGRAGFNLVEVLITLTMVALLTTTLISFVNDYDDKARLAKAKNDLARLAEAAVLAESRSSQRMVPVTDENGSVSTSEVPTLLNDYILELPPEDPWGNRFVVSVDGTVVRSSTEGTPYVLDPSFGRFICAGPDGVVNTVLGSGVSDEDNDIVVEFRQQPFLAYAGNFASDGVGIWIARADGTRKERIEDPVSPGRMANMINVVFSPDGSRWAAVDSALGKIAVGNTAANNPAIQTAPKLAAEADYTVSNKTFPFFFPDGQNVGFLAGDGSLRVYDVFTEQTRRLTPGATITEDQNQMSDDLGRIVHVSDQRSYYWRYTGNAATSIAIAVAPDGKVAYGQYSSSAKASDGIYVVLPDGTGTRRIRKGGSANTSPSGSQELDWMPVFWANSNDLVFTAKDANNYIIMRRMGQDGRLEIELYPGAKAELTPRDPLVPSINPEGSRMAFVHTDDGLGKLIKLDGSGFLKPKPGADFEDTIDKSKNNSEFQIDPLNVYQEALWDNEGDRLFLSRDDAGSGIAEVAFRFDQPSLPPVAGSVEDNLDFPSVPGHMALSPDGTLIASVSHPQMGSGEQGVFVFPVFGPQGARTRIHDTAPTGNYVRVTWLSD